MPVCDLPVIPGWLAKAVRERQGTDRRASLHVEHVIGAGQRNQELFRYASLLRDKGLEADEIEASVWIVNEKRCDPPLSRDEVAQIAQSASRYQPTGEIGKAVPAVPDSVKAVDADTPLDACVAVFRRWLHMPDPRPLYLTLASVAANRMPGDPVWLMLVAPPSSGKTEMLVALSHLPDVRFASTLTGDQALLSGTPKARKEAAGGKGGLLRELGDNGILVLKDWTSILELRPDRMASVTAAFREIYDGSWTRLIGEDGGRALEWKGRIGIVTGCTYAIDRHQRAMSSLGERFVYYRFLVDDEEAAIRKANENTGFEAEMREELAGSVLHLFSNMRETSPEEIGLTEQEEQRLLDIARVSVRLRTGVDRDPYHRDIVQVSPPESPMRFNKILIRITKALKWLQAPDPVDIVSRIGTDSIPQDKLRAYAYLEEQHTSPTTRAVASALGLPTTTTRRILEELAAQRYVIRVQPEEGERNQDRWTPQSEFSAMYRRAFGDSLPEWRRGDEVSLDQDDGNPSYNNGRMPGDMATLIR